MTMKKTLYEKETLAHANVQMYLNYNWMLGGDYSLTTLNNLKSREMFQPLVDCSNLYSETK